MRGGLIGGMPNFDLTCVRIETHNYFSSYYSAVLFAVSVTYSHFICYAIATLGMSAYVTNSSITSMYLPS